MSKGQVGDGTYITTPTTCFDPDEFPTLYSTWFRAHSYGEANPTFPAGSTPVEAKAPARGAQTTGCEHVPFDPGVQVDPGTNDVDSPADATVTTTLPFDPAKEGGEVRNEGKEGIMQSHVRKAEVALPDRHGPQPLRGARPRRLHRRSVQEGRADLRRTNAPPRPRSARSKSTRRRWPSR